LLCCSRAGCHRREIMWNPSAAARCHSSRVNSTGNDRCRCNFRSCLLSCDGLPLAWSTSCLLLLHGRCDALSLSLSSVSFSIGSLASEQASRSNSNLCVPERESRVTLPETSICGFETRVFYTQRYSSLFLLCFCCCSFLLEVVLLLVMLDRRLLAAITARSLLRTTFSKRAES